MGNLLFKRKRRATSHCGTAILPTADLDLVISRTEMPDFGLIKLNAGKAEFGVARQRSDFFLHWRLALCRDVDCEETWYGLGCHCKGLIAFRHGRSQVVIAFRYYMGTHLYS